MENNDALVRKAHQLQYDKNKALVIIAHQLQCALLVARSAGELVVGANEAQILKLWRYQSYRDSVFILLVHLQW